MKKNLNISKIFAVTGLLLGGFTISAIAAWTAPTFNPPSCPSATPGCDAPIHVGSSWQKKNGRLSIGSGSINDGTSALNVVGGTVIDSLSVALNTVLSGNVKINTSGMSAGSFLVDEDGTGKAVWREGVKSISSGDNIVEITSDASRRSVGNVQVKINQSNLVSKGSVGGGCWARYPSNGIGSVTYQCWGNAHDYNSATQSWGPNCDAGYSAQKISETIPSPPAQAFLCLKN